MLILLVDFYKPYVMKYAPSNALFCQFERHRLWIQMWFKTLYLFFIILVSCLRSCSFRCRQILAILLAAFKKELILAELLLLLFLPRFFGLSIICTSAFTDVDYSNRSKTRTYFIFLKAFYFSKTLSSIICIAVFRTFDYLYLGFPDFRLFFIPRFSGLSIFCTSVFTDFDFVILRDLKLNWTRIRMIKRKTVVIQIQENTWPVGNGQILTRFIFLKDKLEKKGL